MHHSFHPTVIQMQIFANETSIITMTASQVTTIHFIYKHAHLRGIADNNHSFHSTHRAYNYLSVSKIAANQLTVGVHLSTQP